MGNKKPKGYWSYERCEKEAIKYNTRGEFQSKSPSAYRISHKNNWLDEISTHMTWKQKSHGYWSYEKCKEVALRFEYKSVFKQNFPTAYKKALNEKWIDEICSHMKELGNKNKRCIYVCVFPDKKVYVGLTYNFEKRKLERLNDKKDAVTEYSILSGLSYEMLKLTNYIDKNIASNLEGTILNMYKKVNWGILNKGKTGGLGGSSVLYWTYERCKNIAETCKNRSEFYKKNASAYNRARLKGWLDMFFAK
jgi:hypothetical protein